MSDTLHLDSWYKVRSSNPHNATPCVDLDKLADVLPHGSGIDGDYYITVFRNGNVDVQGEYHHMNENGMYDGWSTFTLHLKRATSDKRVSLIGPCAGKVQVLHRRGDVLLTLTGGRRNDVRDYLWDVLYFALVDGYVWHTPSYPLEDATNE